MPTNYLLDICVCVCSIIYRKEKEGGDMQIVIDFDDIDLNSIQSDIIRDWIEQLIKDKSTDNLSPLRYADTFKIK